MSRARNASPADVPTDHPDPDLLKTAPEDWRQQSREQKIAINQFHIAAITAHFRHSVKKDKVKAAALPLDQRLANYIIEGTRDGLIADLDRKRAGNAAQNFSLKAGWDNDYLLHLLGIGN